MDRRLLFRVIGIGAGTFLLGFLVTAGLMWLGSPRRVVVTVPDVRSLTVPQARRQLQRADLELVLGDSLPNPQMPAGAVLAQSPLPGSEVGPESEVRVILSSGRQKVAIPPVAALSREQAIRLLTASGFRVVLQEVPSTRAAGRVLGTQPAAGGVVPVPAAVRLLISSGPPRVAVPPLVGLREGELAAVLEDAGLRLGEVRRELRLLSEEGEVLSQNPAPGDSLVAGGAVDVVVATHQILGAPIPDTP